MTKNESWFTYNNFRIFGIKMNFFRKGYFARILKALIIYYSLSLFLFTVI